MCVHCAPHCRRGAVGGGQRQFQPICTAATTSASVPSSNHAAPDEAGRGLARLLSAKRAAARSVHNPRSFLAVTTDDDRELSRRMARSRTRPDAPHTLRRCHPSAPKGWDSNAAWSSPGVARTTDYRPPDFAAKQPPAAHFRLGDTFLHRRRPVFRTRVDRPEPTIPVLLRPIRRGASACLAENRAAGRPFFFFLAVIVSKVSSHVTPAITGSKSRHRESLS